MWKATAPSNIALIKYMGKEPGNRSVNASLSMTLSAFTTTVELEPLGAGATEDKWSLLTGATPLREASTRKFLDFFATLKSENGVSEKFMIRSGNNFPSDAGLASSASSFAALTTAAFAAFTDLTDKKLPEKLELARTSRRGSGSSCRSFFSPWCAWEGDEIFPVKSSLPPLTDFVLILESGYKKVSSSKAHERVRTSPLFAGRIERALDRAEAAKKALANSDFKALAEISWAELWDMHSLFHTSAPPFFYFVPETLRALRWVEDAWEKDGTGPIATIDAGPNVHLLVPTTEADAFRARLKREFTCPILESQA